MIARRPLAAATLGLLCAALWAGTTAAAFGVSPSPASPPVEPQPYLPAADFPTNMAFAPDGRLFFTEKDTGAVRVVEDGRLLPDSFAAFPVTEGGETGLLGIALHPDFPDEPWVYLTLSYKPTDMNRLLRARAVGNRASDVEPVRELLSAGPGYHNGGDIAFGPDGNLYVTVGEIHEPDRAQVVDDIGGKILRLEPDGSVPADNPFGADNPAYSMGHRNSFGICFDPETGDLWETENGPDAHDEVNRIEPGANYGWPDVMGPGGAPEFVDPVVDFPAIIAPTGCAVWQEALWFGDIQGGLHRYPLPIDPADPQGEQVHSLPAGVTDLQVGPDGALYVATVDSILRLGPDGAPVAAVATPAGTRAAPTPASEGSGGSSATAAWIAAAVAGVVVLIGGLWFRRLAKREDARG